MTPIEIIAERCIDECGLTLERVRRSANKWADESTNSLAPQFRGNAHDWEEIGLFNRLMLEFCEKLSSSDKATLRQSGHVITIHHMTASIIDLDRFIMYRALAPVVWQMVEKAG